MVRSEIIEIVKNRLIKAYNPRELYLFGSFAWGNPDEQSDLDMLVIVDKSDEKPYKRAINGIEALMGLRIAKDILVYTKDEFDKLSADVSTLCYKIKKEGIKLYEAV
ncbi:MAG: nucleotidyltransferase domain-containing protein [Nitrospirae bacterium]|nr:nucleotidyltransferase domain-containing protein [Nitrospirota bacterium]